MPDTTIHFASCNLNGTGIVRSLLGIDSLPKRAVKKDVPRKIINLLELAAPNAAVRKNRKAYRQQLADALKK